MKTQALLLADDPVYRGWLDECLAGEVAILPADARERDALVEEVDATPGVGLVFIQFDSAQAHERAGIVEGLLERHPNLPVVAVGDSEQSDTVLSAMRAGARDYFVLNRDDDNLVALVDRVLRRTPSSSATAAGSLANGRLYAVVSSQPNASVPFIGSHMALALQQAGGENQRVLLLDLSLPGGASLVFLDTEQGYSALDALRDVYRCDQTLIDTAFTRYRDGFYLLSLPETSVAPPVIDADDLGRLLETFMSFFDATVVAVDCGVSIAPLAAVLGRAHRSILVTDQSVLKSRQNKHLLHALRQADCPLDNMGLVIDHYQPRLGLEPDRLASLLDLECLVCLTGKPQARIEAMNAGEPMFEHAPRDNFPREIRTLVEQITGEKVEAGPDSGLLGRLFSG